MVGSSPPQLHVRPLGSPSERPIEILTEDGLVLDGRITVPEHARRAVVIAHPHPLYGGCMDDPMVLALTRALNERGAATLRFDFRGVGRSEGRHDGAREVLDLLAAVSCTTLPTSVVGYSFGSWVALQAARTHQRPIERIALLSPALTILGYDAVPPGSARYERPIAIALGDRDGFANAARARVLAGRLGASIAVLSGEDHFFSRSRRRVAELLAPFLLGERERIDEGDLLT